MPFQVARRSERCSGPGEQAKAAARGGMEAGAERHTGIEIDHDIVGLGRLDHEIGVQELPEPGGPATTTETDSPGAASPSTSGAIAAAREKFYRALELGGANAGRSRAA